MSCMQCLCVCANAECLNLLNLSTLFLKAEVGGALRSALGCPWGAMQLKAILLSSYREGGAGVF